jgi:hypothetical protein
MSGWEQLVVKRFKCGHAKTPENTYSAGFSPAGYPLTRCKQCHRTLMRQWYRDHRTAA